MVGSERLIYFMLLYLACSHLLVFVKCSGYLKTWDKLAYCDVQQLKLTCKKEPKACGIKDWPLKIASTILEDIKIVIPAGSSKEIDRSKSKEKG